MVRGPKVAEGLPPVIGNRASEIDGVVVSKFESMDDERGKFVKLSQFAHFQGSLSTAALSFNPNVGTVRGIHFQVEPFSEEKLVSCVQGSIFDAVVDLRPSSKTFGMWCSYELTADNGIQLFIPKGVAHGFQTLLPNSIIHYVLSGSHAPQHSFAINPFGDLKIAWPTKVSSVSKGDLSGLSFSLAARQFAESLKKK